MSDPGRTIRDGLFGVSLHNDLHNQGLAPLNHSLCIYADSTAIHRIFQGDVLMAGHSITYLVPLATGRDLLLPMRRTPPKK